MSQSQGKGSSITRPITAPELEREERRALFLLGFLAVIVTLRLSAQQADRFIFFDLSYSLVTTLDFLIYFWAAYAAFMLVFLSDDLVLNSRTGIAIRRLSQSAGLACAFLPPLLLGWILVSLPTALSISYPFSVLLLLFPWVIMTIYLYIFAWRIFLLATNKLKPIVRRRFRRKP